MINKLKRSLGLSKKQEGVKLHYKAGLNTAADYTIKPGGIIKYTPEEYIAWQQGAGVERFYFDEAGHIDTGAMEKLQKGMKINETPKSANEQWADSWAERLGQ